MAAKATLLIDGDQFVFKATAALEREVQWDDQNHVLYSNAEECWSLLTAMLDRVFQRFESEHHALCFGSGPYFRHELFPDYKPGRGRKPLCYSRLRENVEGKYNCITMPGLEADDVMGILATKPGMMYPIIVSQDKDMKSIPTTVWDGEDLHNVSEQQADYWHLYQTLVGDTSDGYKGCPGVGPVKAQALLSTEPTGSVNPEMTRVEWNWMQIIDAFQKAKLTEADALLQARLARILRWSDWDSENKKPILWTPPVSSV